MTYSNSDFLTVLNKFRDGRNWVNEVEVKVDGDVNELAPLDMIRMYEGDVTVDNLLSLTTQMILNKEVSFIYHNKEIFRLIYTGGDLGVKFKAHPYLIDVLLKTCYGILIKKLTPPFVDSETEERPQV